MTKSSHVTLWDDCLKIIQDNVPESTYKTWFAPIVPLKYADNTLVIQVPSQFFYEFLEERFVDLLRQTIYKVIGEGTKLMYNVMVDKNAEATVNLEGSNRSTAIKNGNTSFILQALIEEPQKGKSNADQTQTKLDAVTISRK